MGGGKVISIGRHAASSYFCIDMGTATTRVLVLLQDQGTSPLSHDKPVAINIERARCRSRIFVTRRKCFHRRETADTRLVNRGFRPSRDNNISFSPPYIIHGIDDSRRRSSTCRYSCKVRPHKSVSHGDPSRRNVDNNFRYKVWINTRRSVPSAVFNHLLLERVKAAIARPPDNSDPCLVKCIGRKSSVTERFVSTHHCILRERIHFPDFTLFKVSERIKSFNFTCEMRSEARGVETGNWSGAAFAGDKV